MTKLDKKYDELKGSCSPAVRLYVDYFLLQIQETYTTIVS